MSERKKNLIYSVVYALMVFGLVTIYAVLIMDNIQLDITEDYWYTLLTYTVILITPVGLLRLLGNREILPIKIGIVLMIIVSMLLAGIDASFAIYSILLLSILNMFNSGKPIKRIVKKW